MGRAFGNTFEKVNLSVAKSWGGMPTHYYHRLKSEFVQSKCRYKSPYYAQLPTDKKGLLWCWRAIDVDSTAALRMNRTDDGKIF